MILEILPNAKKVGEEIKFYQVDLRIYNPKWNSNFFITLGNSDSAIKPSYNLNKPFRASNPMFTSANGKDDAIAPVPSS